MTLLVLVEVFSICFTAVAAFLIFLFYDQSSSNKTLTSSPNYNDQRTSSTNWIGLTFVGLCLMTICIIGLRGADLVNLNLLLVRYVISF